MRYEYNIWIPVSQKLAYSISFCVFFVFSSVLQAKQSSLYNRLSLFPSLFVLFLSGVSYTSASILILCFRFSLPPCLRVKSKNLWYLLKARCSALVSHLLAVSRMSQARNVFTFALRVINTLCPSFGLLYSDCFSEKSSFSYLSLEIYNDVVRRSVLR